MHRDVDPYIDLPTNLLFVLLKKDWCPLDVDKDALHVGNFKLHDVLCLTHQHFEVSCLRVCTSVLILKEWVLIHSEA